VMMTVPPPITRPAMQEPNRHRQQPVVGVRGGHQATASERSGHV
jgi:hypothetical protein